MEAAAGFAIIIYIAVMAGFMWAFYMWGAHIAESKGRSRSLGWWSAFFGLIAIIILYCLSDARGVMDYIPRTASPPKQDLATQLGRLGALREQGALSSDEFERAKADLLARHA